MSNPVKFRVIGTREDIQAMIEALDPVLDITEDWRIYPQRNGIGFMAYLAARPRASEEDTCHD